MLTDDTCLHGESLPWKRVAGQFFSGGGMPTSLMERAARFVATKQGATALAIVPLAMMLAKPQKATATVLFGFTAASSGLSNPGPAPVNVTSSPLPNGGLHITGDIGPLASSDYYGGVTSF